HKKQGYGAKLLEKVIEAAKDSNMDGVVVMTIREKKGGWSPKPRLFEKKNFKLFDSILDSYDIYALKLKKNAHDPKFFPMKEISEDYQNGTHVFVSYQCPYMVGTIESLKKITETEFQDELHIHEIQECDTARELGFHPYGTFHITHKGQYITHLPGGMRDIQKEFEKIGKNL
ncbi:MAG: hypothetical protein ACTSRD_12560, partial [Promethearchaeota archaeon]